MVIRLTCPAKLNLFLEVLGRRPDGYHELLTVMTPIDLADTLEVRPARRFTLKVDGPRLDGLNTVEKAFRAVARRRRLPGARVRLVKRIPAGSGLGGGSSDAAAMIRALDRIYHLDLTLPEQTAIAAEVGSDVPFFLAGGPALCAGRGEIVSLLPHPRLLHAVLICPSTPSLTREVYARLRLSGRTRNVIAFLNAYEKGDLQSLKRALFNRLESAAGKPPSPWRLTGSGSARFRLCSSAEEARRLAASSGGVAITAGAG